MISNEEIERRIKQDIPGPFMSFDKESAIALLREIVLLRAIANRVRDLGCWDQEIYSELADIYDLDPEEGHYALKRRAKYFQNLHKALESYAAFAREGEK